MSDDLRKGVGAYPVLMSGAVPAVALGTKTDAHIEAVRYSGSGNVSVSESGLYLWQSATHRFTATISATSGIEAELCLVSLPTGAETGEELTCKRTAIPANTTETETISVKGWPTGLNGSQEVGILLRSANGSGSTTP
jgi:hypothetical protein